jgi:CRP-like cAMP-binding protein
VLEAALSSHFLIGTADQVVRTQIIRAVERHEFAVGDEIIKEGETGAQADKFYILESGKTSVIQGGEEVYVYEEGSCFGDIALLYDCPRTANVVCKEAATVWTINRATFRAVLSQNDEKEADACRAAIGQVEILAGLTESQIDAVSDALVKMTFEKGDLIMKKGEAGELFYFLSDGEVAVREIENKDTGDELEGVTIKAGSKRSYFGEHALLSNEPRGATIQVVSDTCTCLGLDRDDFNHVLGPLQDVLNQNTIVTTCATKIRVFRCMTGYERETLSECMLVSEVGDGDIIIDQDDDSATFTIILKGEAVTEGKTGKTYFGELGLLDAVWRAPADVVAQGPVTIAQISREVFSRELGVTLEEIKERGDLDRRASHFGGKFGGGGGAKFGGGGSFLNFGASADLVADMQFEDLEVRQVIGSGNFGRVSIAKDKASGMHFAVKQLSKMYIQEMGIAFAVMREKEVMKNLMHPFVTQVRIRGGCVRGGGGYVMTVAAMAVSICRVVQARCGWDSNVNIVVRKYFLYVRVTYRPAPPHPPRNFPTHCSCLFWTSSVGVF